MIPSSVSKVNNCNHPSVECPVAGPGDVMVEGEGGEAGLMLDCALSISGPRVLAEILSAGDIYQHTVNM